MTLQSMDFLRHQSLISFWGKFGAHICLPFLSSLEGTECVMADPCFPTDPPTRVN